MTIAEIIQIALGSSGLAGIAYLIFRTGRIVERIDGMDERFISIDKRFDKVDIQLKEIREDIHSIDIRLAVLESENIIYNIMPDSNSRSEIAKNVWKKRKQRALASISGDK